MKGEGYGKTKDFGCSDGVGTCYDFFSNSIHGGGGCEDWLHRYLSQAPRRNMGETGKMGVDFATDEINAEGGIKALGGAKLKIIYGDSQGKPEIGATITEQLIHKDNVAMITGALQSGVTLPSTAVAERYKVPYLVLTAVNVDITNRGFKYTFRSKQTANRDAELMVEGAYAIGDKTG